jgi:hypothetical protein
MNDKLEQLAQALALDEPGREPWRLAFGLACAERVRHLLEEPEAIECLDVLHSYVNGNADAAALQQARARIAQVASSHRGSNSIDGSAHAAVSATYALAHAMAGRALQAANYAAYAMVYAYGGYAVNDRAAFEPEFAWQVATLEELSRSAPLPA